MNYLALYRKYRPKSFDEVEGQKEIIKVLKNSINNNRISHAYLFSGPRGTGKTTTAKIISKLVNCENLVDGQLCGKCKSCLSNDNNDIIEIDAASNNGVDEIREIRDNANLVPSNCKYKIYIIDEVHMLTTQAFNALLKTLEEPPKHIIFILATTEYYKIPLTVVSRCQVFKFNKLSNDDIVNRLKYISEKENIKITDDALYEIARLSDGAMRDAINLLDQINSYNSDVIDLKEVYSICDIVSSNEIVNFLANIKDNNTNKIVEFIESINNRGFNLNKIVEEIIYFLKDALIYNFNPININKAKLESIEQINQKFSFEEINSLIIKFNEIINKLKYTNYPSIILIVETLNLVNGFNFVDIIKTKPKEETKQKTVKEEKIISSFNEEEKQNLESIESSNKINSKLKNIRINNTFVSAEKQKLSEFKELWNKIFDYILDDNFGSIVGVLKDCSPIVVGDNNVILLSNYDNIADRINDERTLVESLFTQVYGKEYKIVCLTSSEWNIEKEKYINNKKNNINYSYIKEEEKQEENFDRVNELIDIVGSDLVEFI